MSFFQEGNNVFYPLLIIEHFRAPCVHCYKNTIMDVMTSELTDHKYISLPTPDHSP